MDNKIAVITGFLIFGVSVGITEYRECHKREKVSFAQWSSIGTERISEKECKPVSHWTICDDGFVVHATSIVDHSLDVALCELHGLKDARQFRFESVRTGHNWKVVVTPVNEKPQYSLGIPKSDHDSRGNEGSAR